jgi:hypothetical protein
MKANRSAASGRNQTTPWLTGLRKSAALRLELLHF